MTTKEISAAASAVAQEAVYVREKQFSFFPAPITNKKPSQVMTLRDAYIYITGMSAYQRTRQLREIADHEEARRFKRGFDYVTFSGTFSYCSDTSLMCHSGLLCLDFDHVGDVRAVKETLLADPYFPPQLLFTSPSGDGVKDVVEIDLRRCDHRLWFRAVKNYMMATYGLEADEKCVNVSRACYLPYDADAYVNPIIFAF